MAPPPRAPLYPTSNPLITDFQLRPAFHQQLSTTPDQLSSRDTFALGTSFTSTHVPSQHQPAIKLCPDTSQSVVLDGSDFLIGNDQQDTQDQTTHLLQDLTDSLTPYANVRHDSKVFQHDPWNPVAPVITSMVTQSNQSLSNQQQSKKRPITDDSGYASSQKSRRITSNHQGTGGPVDQEPVYTYNDPIDSVAQQIHFLPDQQQHQRTSITTITADTPRAPPSVTADSVAAPSGNQSFRCDECGEASSTKSELHKHMARHNKKYKCDFPQCSRGTDGFATKNDLDRHKGSVHRDETVARREYRCSVAGCKDPNKIWDRKDNFKAHVIRMHPEMDPNIVVDQSFIRENQPSINRTYSHADSQTQVQAPSLYFTPGQDQMPMFDPSYMPSYDNRVNAGLDDEDMYGPPASGNQRQQMYAEQFDHNLYRSQRSAQHAAFPGSATIQPSNYTSSNTILPGSNQYDGVPPLIPYRENYMSFTYPNGTVARPFDAQTAPPIGRNTTDDLQSHVFEWNHNYDTTSVVDGGVSAIDPYLQQMGTIGSGSWQLMSPTAGYPQSADIPDQPPQSTPAITTEEQPQPVQEIDDRRDAVWQQLKSILKQLPPDQMKTMIEAWEKHPPVSNKDTCAVKSAIDAVKAFQNADEKPLPFPCRRTNTGCTKRFSQNNIRKKHERRHDRAFFCTYDGCYSTFGSKDDLRRHEKAHEKKKSVSQDYQGWRCFIGDVPTSHHKTNCSRYFENEEEFQQHRRDEHRERAAPNNGGLKASKNCHVHQGQPGNFWCGFCEKVKLNEPNSTDGTKCDKFRYDHIDAHITKERKTMRHWIDLKSEGLTKTEVKKFQQQEAGLPVNDESDDDYDDDEDVDEASPAVSATMTGPSSQTPARFGQFLDVPGNSRKRSRSDADHIPLPPVKQPRTVTYPAPRQAPNMVRRASDMPPNPRPGASIKHPLSARGIMIACCQCKYKREIGGISCGYGACFHTYCRNCTFWDIFGNSVVPKANFGRGQGNNN